MEKKIKKKHYSKILREQKKELLEDIRTLIMTPETEKGIVIKIKYRTMFQAEDILFYGDATAKGDGIQNFIKKQNN